MAELLGELIGPGGIPPPYFSGVVGVVYFKVTFMKDAIPTIQQLCDVDICGIYAEWDPIPARCRSLKLPGGFHYRFWIHFQ